MKLLHSIRPSILIPVAVSSYAALAAAEPSTGADTLWYAQPAEKWEEALPVGNGRLGAMVFGGVATERLQLNEGTLWAGGPYDPVNPEARAALPEVRCLIDEGRFKEADALLSAKVMAKPLKQMPYQTVGDLLLTFADTSTVGDYRRELDLDSATTSVAYTRDGVRYTREVFASAPDNVIVVRLAADKPGKISFVAGMKTPMAASVSTSGGDTLVMEGRGGDSDGIKGQLRYQARVKILATGGKVAADATTVTVAGADESRCSSPPLRVSSASTM